MVGTVSDEREVLTARVTGRAKCGWVEYCGGHGVTFAAVVEAMGVFFADNPEWGEGDSDAVGPVIAAARDIDRRRRARK